MPKSILAAGERPRSLPFICPDTPPHAASSPPQAVFRRLPWHCAKARRLCAAFSEGPAHRPTSIRKFQQAKLLLRFLDLRLVVPTPAPSVCTERLSGGGRAPHGVRDPSCRARIQADQVCLMHRAPARIIPCLQGPPFLIAGFGEPFSRSRCWIFTAAVPAGFDRAS